MISSTKKPRLEKVGEEDTDTTEQEETLIALIEHRAKEVDLLRKRVAYFQSQLDEAEKKLNDSESQLGRLRSRNRKPLSNGFVDIKPAVKSGTVIDVDGSPSTTGKTPHPRPQLIIPAVKPRSSPPVKSSDLIWKPSTASVRIEQKVRKDLVPLICSSSAPSLISFQAGVHISSQHKRKLRSLVLNPVNDQLFVTSALDGIVNLWQIQARGPDAYLLSTTDCMSPKQRRWPEDIAWHPHGHSLFAVYTADGGDSQVSILDTNSRQRRVSFLEEKPHVKGIINSIVFISSEAGECFATGGSDHAVVIWSEKGEENSWKPRILHRNLHSSAVMGLAGMQEKQILISVGVDKRIIGYDLLSGRADYRHQIETKCLSVLPNPSDVNLFMVQTGAPEKQLRLFDIRLRQTEIHVFGWKQESSESQSALINQSWSHDGLYISSGSADPMFHIFDIRYKGTKPSQSVKAHQKRVFKAEWHQSLPLLVSISSDLQIGLHKYAY